MAEDRCQTCGGPLPRRAGRRGRAAVYCSAACRQKAYRSRHAPAGGEVVRELIADIERRVQSLALQPPSAFYSDVTALSSTVGTLRRIARIASDASAAPEIVTPAREIVTPAPVTEFGPAPGENAAAVDAVRSGDESTFAGMVEPYRRELHVHCYRMVGSYDDSEDLVQETFLRAWRGRAGFEGRSSFRAWLYRIATNSCLDFLRRNSRRPQPYEPIPGMDHGSAEPPTRVTWLQPYPDRLLDEVASDEAQPDAAAVSRETIELVFLAAIQHLPPRQRAVLILRDVLGWQAAEAAELLDLSVASANSALQRARPTLRKHLPERRLDWTSAAEPTKEERALVARFVEAMERTDLAAVAELLSDDLTLTMPPNPFWFVGRDTFLKFLRPTLDPASPMYFGRWRSVPTRANRQLAVANYTQRPGTTVYRAQVLDVLRIEGGKIVQITSFEPHLFPAFGLPLTH